MEGNISLMPLDCRNIFKLSNKLKGMKRERVQEGSPALRVRPVERSRRTSRLSWTELSQDCGRIFLQAEAKDFFKNKKIPNVEHCKDIRHRGSGYKKGLTGRKSSVIGFGERFSSLVSISSQVAHMMGVTEMGWPLGSDLEPNDLVDKLITEMILTASHKSVSEISDVGIFNWKLVHISVFSES